MKIKKPKVKPHVQKNKIIYWRGLYETFCRHYSTWPTAFWATKRDAAANELIKLGHTPT
jgi:hypothetical protein